MLSRHQSKEQKGIGNTLAKFNRRHSLAKRVSCRSFCADKYTYPPMSRASPWFLLSPNENSGRKYSEWKTVPPFFPDTPSWHLRTKPALPRLKQLP